MMHPRAAVNDRVNAVRKHIERARRQREIRRAEITKHNAYATPVNEQSRAIRSRMQHGLHRGFIAPPHQA